MSDRARWRTASAWTGHVPPELSSATGVAVDLLDAVSMATIIVRRGHEVELDRLLQPRFGCAAPTAGRASLTATGTLVWSAPGQWLAVATPGTSLDDLAPLLAGVAAVTDQSDSRALVEIKGPRAREVLARGFAIDLHPSVFAAGAAAVTKVAHLSVQVWQTDDAPTYRIAVPRSFAGTFQSWLLEAACAPFTAATPCA